jgi:hypothetical protein
MKMTKMTSTTKTSVRITAQKELADQLAQIQSDLRSRSVKDVLANKGVPEKVAKFIPGDISTPEAVDAWLSENADVFGFQIAGQESASQSDEMKANVAAYQRINAATQNASTPPRDQEIAAKIAGAKTVEELNALTGLPNQRFRG